MQMTFEPAMKRLDRVSSFLACPDTNHDIVVQDQHLVCPRTGRHFEPIQGLPAIFPLNWIDTLEISAEEQFYINEDSIPFRRSHELAHLNARLPIKAWCETTGIREKSWTLLVGAGPGNQDLQIVKKFTRNILAIDVSPSAVAKFIESQPFPCLLGTASSLPLKSNSFDGIVMSGVLHHVAGYQHMLPYLREAIRVLKPGGAFISVDPNLLFPVSIVMTALDVVGQRVRPGWRHHVPHERPLVPLHLSWNFRRAGFVDVKLLGTSYVHNKFPWFLAKFLDMTTTGLVKKRLFRHFGYWIGCSGVKKS